MNSKLTYKLLFLMLFELIIFGYTYLITNKTFNFFSVDLLNDVYDSLLLNLLHGSFQVSNKVSQWETFVFNGKSFIYFGAFPSFVRLLLYVFSYKFIGASGAISSLIAAVFSVLAFYFIIKKALLINQSISEQDKRLLILTLIIGFAFGSPILYLLPYLSVYHEAMLWGLCWSLWSLYLVILILSQNINNKWQVLNLFLLFSISIGFCLHSRVMFAMPFLVLFVVLLLKMLFSLEKNNLNLKAVFFLVTVPSILLLFFLALQLMRNYETFGSIFTFVNYKYYDKPIYGEYRLFDLARLPISLKYYFWFDTSKFFINTFPYIQFYVPETIEKYFVQKDNTCNFIVLNFWCVVFSLQGFFYLIKRNNKFEYLILFLFLVQNIFIFSFFSISYRYLAELIPLITYLTFIFLQNIKMPFKKFCRLNYIYLIVFLILSSSFVNLLIITRFFKF